MKICESLTGNFQHPIKGAIVISRIRREDTHFDDAIARAQNVCDFLTSLSEGNSMSIYVVVNEHSTVIKDSKIRSTTNSFQYLL